MKKYKYLLAFFYCSKIKITNIILLIIILLKFHFSLYNKDNNYNKSEIKIITFYN